jgi:chorismate dehydratase
MVRVAAISYLNTLPFVFGLERSTVSKQIEMVACTPSESADKLLSGEIDLGIVPVAIIPQSDNLEIVTDYCIGADGPVASVLICSGVPLNKVDEIFLDEDSRTSALLTKVLAHNYWGISPKYSSYTFNENSPLDLSKTYLLIGDKAMEHSSEFEFCYDLAFEWKCFKNEPFVFALWTANKKLDTDFLASFSEALGYGVSHIEDCVENKKTKFSKEIALAYLNNNISYNLNIDKRRALSDFWSMTFESSKFRVRW